MDPVEELAIRIGELEQRFARHTEHPPGDAVADSGEAEQKFKAGDVVKTNRGNRETVVSVRHPLVYTRENPGGWHWTKVFK